MPDEFAKTRAMLDQGTDLYQTNIYNLEWFQVLTFRENLDTGACSFVVYGEGKHEGHLMDWRGCNFFHGRIPGSPTFKTFADAVLWLDRAMAADVLHRGMDLSGHHAGENECRKGCAEREVATIFINSRDTITREHRGAGVHVSHVIRHEYLTDADLKALPVRIYRKERK